MRTITSIILTSIAFICSIRASSAQVITAPARATVLAAAAANQNTLNSTDRKFIQTTAQGLIFEVLGGGIATVHTGTFDVKEFGEKMIIDHRRDYVQLTALATSLGVPAPTITDSTHLKVLGTFNSRVGTAFDKTYINYEIQDHITDIHDYLNEVRNGKNIQVRAFAASHLTELYQHLQIANNIAIANGLKR